MARPAPNPVASDACPRWIGSHVTVFSKPSWPGEARYIWFDRQMRAAMHRHPSALTIDDIEQAYREALGRQRKRVAKGWFPRWRARRAAEQLDRARGFLLDGLRLSPEYDRLSPVDPRD